MFRIDLIYVNSPVLARVREVAALPRGILDHAPILLQIQVKVTQANCLCRLSRYWVTETQVEPRVHCVVLVF